MIVSWNWLKQYVPLDMPAEELERRLMMAGLNHEETNEVGGDLAIDLEVTSNRPDCLGHLGIAREVAVLWKQPLKIPPAQPREAKTAVDGLVKVRIECPDLCLRYTARVIRGVKIAPSPSWMVRRLETVGIAAINNVVDISNYVLMECGQPLHTFDFGKLQGAASGAAKEIIVRRPRPGEKIEAIDHKTYDLAPEMCMICDARQPVAIGGVMGGAQTEISAATHDVLIEAAEFDPVSIRSTARQLNLHSDSSYRFERRVDPEGLDWASRRCCELILELAGGELAAGVVDVGQQPPKREPVMLRLSQLKRVLGIDVPVDRVREILLALGNQEVVSGEWRVTSGQRTEVRDQGADNENCEMQNAKCKMQSEKLKGLAWPALATGHSPLATSPNPSSLAVIPPSWRRDLTREIDLIEEVARIHGYEAIPEDVGVPMVPSARTRADRVLERVRRVLTAAGFDEAVTLSVVDEKTSAAMSPWTEAEPLRSQMPVIRGANCLRRSLIPSLINVRQTNEALANAEIELFEIARVYLPQEGGLPREELMLAITSARPAIRNDKEDKQDDKVVSIKGTIEAIVAELKIGRPLESDDAKTAQAHAVAALDPAASCSLRLGGELLGYVGQLTTESTRQFDLRGPSTVAEVKLGPLIDAADLIPKYTQQSPYPAVTRDINLVVDEAVRWADVAATASTAGREHTLAVFEGLEYRDTYWDAKRLGAMKKSFLFTVSLRWSEGTLTSQQADEVRDRIVAACREKHGAELRA